MNLKINEDIFLGKQELNRFKKSIFDKGFKLMFKNSVKSYGIVNLLSDVNFNNLRIVQGTAINKLTLKSGYAVDGDVNIITAPSDQIDVLTTPTNNVYRYIKISYGITNLEEGTVSISTDGTLTGTGTKFTELLRGQPNFPTKIKFPLSAGNTLEYEVLSVTNDTTAKLAGSSFIAELNLQYVALATVTPGVSVPSGNKEIYELDYYTIVLSSSSSLAANQYMLAKVKSDGITTDIVDLRNQNIFTLNVYSPSLPLATINNPLIGVENAKYSTVYADKSENLVKVGFGYRSSSGNWTVDVTNNKITLNSGSGGIFSGNASVSVGDFNGWRVYFNNGLFAKVLTNTISGSDVILNLQQFDSNNFPTTGDIVVVPDADFVELKTYSSVLLKAEDELTYPIHIGYAIIPVKVGSPVQIFYRNILNGTTATYQLIKDGTYLNETSFDDNGVLTVSNTSSVTLGVYTPLVSATNFKDNKADKSSNNTFTALNFFQKTLSQNKGADINVTLSPNGSHKSLVFVNDGNYFSITDSSNLLLVESITAPTLGMPIIYLDFATAVTLKNNVTINATDQTLGYKPLRILSNTDVTINARDICQFSYFGSEWVLTNIFRTQDTQDPTNGFNLPIVGLDNSCVLPVDNKLGNILQAIITTVCAMSTGNLFAFIANKSTDQNFSGSGQLVTFDDDINPPYFDNGNDFHVDRYVVPQTGLAKQRFIVENISIENTGLVPTTITIEIQLNGTMIAQGVTASIGAGATGTLASIISPYQTGLLEDDEVTVKITNNSTNQVCKFKTGARFSNSF